MSDYQRIPKIDPAFSAFVKDEAGKQGLRTAALNALLRNGVRRMGDFRYVSLVDIGNFRGMGVTTKSYVYDFLVSYGNGLIDYLDNPVSVPDIVVGDRVFLTMPLYNGEGSLIAPRGLDLSVRAVFRLKAGVSLPIYTCYSEKESLLLYELSLTEVVKKRVN